MKSDYYKMMYAIEARYAKRLREENHRLRDALRVSQDTLNSLLRLYNTMADCQGATLNVRVSEYSTGYKTYMRTDRIKRYASRNRRNRRKHRR